MPKTSLPPCDDRRDQLLLLAVGGVPPEAQKDLEAHLKTCPGCKKTYERHKQASDLLQRLPQYQIHHVIPPRLARRWAKEEKTGRIRMIVDKQQHP